MVQVYTKGTTGEDGHECICPLYNPEYGKERIKELRQECVKEAKDELREEVGSELINQGRREGWEASTSETIT